MDSTLLKSSVILSWIKWYLIDAPRNIIQAWFNFLKFNLKFFSIYFLIRTLFSYWHKYSWSYGRGFDIRRYLEVFFSNLTSRILGSIVRVSLILIGLISEIAIFITGLIVLILWFVIPIISIIGLITGIALIYHEF